MDTIKLIKDALDWADKRLNLLDEPITETQRHYIEFALSQNLVKNLVLSDVSQQRELLAFLDWVGKNTPSYSVQKPKQIVQAYLKANCG